MHPRVRIRTRGCESTPAGAFPDAEQPSDGRVRPMVATGARWGEHWVDPNVGFLARRYQIFSSVTFFRGDSGQANRVWPAPGWHSRSHRCLKRARHEGFAYDTAGMRPEAATPMHDLSAVTILGRPLQRNPPESTIHAAGIICQSAPAGADCLNRKPRDFFLSQTFSFHSMHG